MKYLYQIHRDAANAPEVLQCSSCHRVFCSTLQLKYHVKRTHSDRTPFICGGCKKPFRRIHELQRHSRQTLTCAGSGRSLAQPATYCCLLCGIGFRSQANLRRHLAGRSHVNDILYTCHNCSAGFLMVDELNLHRVTVHGDWPGTFAGAALRRHRLERRTRAAAGGGFSEQDDAGRCAEEAGAAARSHFSIAGTAGLKLVLKKVVPAAHASADGCGDEKTQQPLVDSAEGSDSEYEPASHTTVDSGKGLSDFDDDGGSAVTPAPAQQPADDQLASSPVAAASAAATTAGAGSKPPLRLSIVIGREPSSASVVAKTSGEPAAAAASAATATGLIKKPRLQLAGSQGAGIGAGGSGRGGAAAPLPAGGAGGSGSVLSAFGSSSSLLRAPTLVSSTGAATSALPPQPAFALSHRPHAPAFSFSRPHEAFGIKAPSLLPPPPPNVAAAVAAAAVARQPELLASSTPSLAGAASIGSSSIGAHRMLPSEVLGRMAGSSLLSQRLGTGNAAAMLAGVPPAVAAALAASRSAPLNQLVVGAAPLPLPSPAAPAAVQAQLALTGTSGSAAATAASAMACLSSPGAGSSSGGGGAGRALPLLSPAHWPGYGVLASPMHASTGGFASPGMQRLPSPFFPGQQFVADVIGSSPVSPAAHPGMPSPALSAGHFGRPSPSFGQSLPCTTGVYHSPVAAAAAAAAAHSFGHWPALPDSPFAPAGMPALLPPQQQQQNPPIDASWPMEGSVWQQGPLQPAVTDVRGDDSIPRLPDGRSSAAAASAATSALSSAPNATAVAARRARSGSQGSLDSRDSGLDYSPLGDLSVQPDRQTAVDVLPDVSVPAHPIDCAGLVAAAPLPLETLAVPTTLWGPVKHLASAEATRLGSDRGPGDSSSIAVVQSAAAAAVVSTCEESGADGGRPEAWSSASLHGEQAAVDADGEVSLALAVCHRGLSLAAAPVTAAERGRPAGPTPVDLETGTGSLLPGRELLIRCDSDVSLPLLSVSIPLALLLRRDMSSNRTARLASKGETVSAVEWAGGACAAATMAPTLASRSADRDALPSLPPPPGTSRCSNDECFQSEHASQYNADGRSAAPPASFLADEAEEQQGASDVVDLDDLDPEKLVAFELGQDCSRTSCGAFERCRFVEDARYLAHLRAKTCAMLLALFPLLRVGGAFSPRTCDVEDLVEAVAELLRRRQCEDPRSSPPPPDADDDAPAFAAFDGDSSAPAPSKSEAHLLTSMHSARQGPGRLASAAEARSDIQRLQRGVCSLVQLLLPHLSWDMLQEDDVSTFDRLLDVMAGAN